MSFALLRRYPLVESAVIDIANVCIVGCEIARELGLQDRITYHPTDFLRDELPTGFDAILRCDVGPYSTGYYRKLRCQLNPSGRLVVIDHFAPSTHVADPSRLHWAFVSSMHGPTTTRITAADVQGFLIETGFETITARPLPTAYTVRWTVGFTIMEA
jgi:hypothetical protein